MERPGKPEAVTTWPFEGSVLAPAVHCVWQAAALMSSCAMSSGTSAPKLRLSPPSSHSHIFQPTRHRTFSQLLPTPNSDASVPLRALQC